MSRLIKTLAAAMVAMSGAASAQVGVTEAEEELRQEQERQFQQMFEDPDNLELMFAYALTSIRLKDYEAAITTLDRILIFNPDLPRVRLELAASYYRIASYPIARFYFQQVIDNPDAEQDLKDRAQEFVDVIDERTQDSFVTGVIAAQALFSTNANNGPDSRDIVFLGLDAELTGDGVTAQTDVGASLSAQIAHVYDLGGANSDNWRTEAAVYSQRFAETQEGAADIMLIRTGPQLSLDEERFGPKARPFVELDHVRSDNSALYTTAGAGVEFRTSISPILAFDADIRVGWRDFHNNSGTVDKDGVNIRGRNSFTYFMDEQTTFRFSGLYEFEGADSAEERALELGAEARVAYTYDSGFDFAGRDWLAMGGIRGIYRFFDEPGIADPNKTRKDVDLRFTVGHTAYLENDLALTMRADYFYRDSNVKNFDLDNLTLSAGVEYAF